MLELGGLDHGDWGGKVSRVVEVGIRSSDWRVLDCSCGIWEESNFFGRVEVGIGSSD
tara:strand:+ start:355 stop:525 length:171 start_codon:yes stop_codon:yes gene_type:complete